MDNEYKSDGWPNTSQDFGAAVKAAREAAGLTRMALADRTDIPALTLRNIEAGRHLTSPERRARLWQVLGPAHSKQSERDTTKAEPKEVPSRLIVDLSGFTDWQASEAVLVLRDALSAYQGLRGAPVAIVHQAHGPEIENDPERFARALDLEDRRTRLAGLLRQRLSSTKVAP